MTLNINLIAQFYAHSKTQKKLKMTPYSRLISSIPPENQGRKIENQGRIFGNSRGIFEKRGRRMHEKAASVMGAANRVD